MMMQSTNPPCACDEAQPVGADPDLALVPEISFVDHIAIAVKSGELDGQVAAYRQLGFREIHREEVLGRDQVREVLLQIGDGPNLIQLLEPLTPDSPVQKLIDKNRGRGGLAHIALRVGNAQRAFDAMQAAGFHLIDKAPRPGSRGTTVFFVHPQSRVDHPFGFLIEIVEMPATQTPPLEAATKAREQ
jgi:methylmalonyl-CoA/ethylmalonyl-CoA epimerase